MKILFISPRVPYPPIKGDKLRTYHFIKRLSKKHDIDLCTFYENKEELVGLEEMKKYCSEVRSVFLPKHQAYVNILRTCYNLLPFQVNYYYSKSMEREIFELTMANTYDIVYISLQRMMLYADYVKSGKIVLDRIDALSLNMKRRAENERNPIKKAIFYFEYLNVRHYERSAKRKYDWCVITSEVDKMAIGDNNIIVVPNGVDTEYFQPQKIEKDIDIIFTGNMGYFPNIDAMKYFSKDIMPKILRKRPDIKLYIVGTAPVNDIKSLNDDKIVFVTGFVKDIREYLNRAKVFIAPLRSGSGIQNKILEAMACALPVVTTLYGNAGIKAEAGKQLVMADEPFEFSQRVLELLKNEQKRIEVGNEARKMAISNFSWSSSVIKLEELYNKVQ